MSEEKPSVAGNQANVNESEVFVLKPDPEGRASNSGCQVNGEKADKHVATMFTPTTATVAVLGSSSNANGEIVALTDPLLASAAGAVSAHENTSNSPASETPPPTKIFKTDADDDTPKTFPQILMEILCNDEESDTISWLPHGRSFIIYKKKKFGAQILPKYFKATKFTSFTRKLNRWGFTRVTRGPEMGSYYHKLFLRDDPQLCLRMSSHSSNKFQEPTTLMPNPMSPTGIPFMPYGMMPAMLPNGMTQVDVAQQNQLISQQLQQLQWQQYQLQQYQQQQQAQQHNHANGPPPSSSGVGESASGQQQQQQQHTLFQPPGLTPAWGTPNVFPNVPVAHITPGTQHNQQQQLRTGGKAQNAGNAVGGGQGSAFVANQSNSHNNTDPDLI